MDTSDEALGADPPWQEDIELPPRRRRLGAWLVFIFVSLSLGLVGWAGEKRYHIVALVKERLAGQATVDPRVDAFVADGEGALAEGRLDSAQGDFDKASVLTDHDPRVLLGAARVAAARADIPWLALRLLPPSARESVRVAKAQLDEQAAIARQTADDALAAAPHDPGALRAKLDSLRLAGDADGARGYVVAVFAQASQPETAYALAMLDLLQASPAATPWPTIIDRLRTGADGSTSGTSADRVRAALVYALAKSGDVPGANAELARLDAEARPYPLLPALHASLGLDAAVATAPQPSMTAAVVAPPAPSTEASASPAAVIPPEPATPSHPVPGSPVASLGDTTFQAAADAVRRGEYDRAERIYQGIVAMHPRDSQALTGLGDVCRLHNDPWGAIEAYNRAIEINPSYLPALIGLADTQWARGDQEGAARSYRRIVDRFPDGMYPGYVSQRAAP